jgi:phage antirepressor YoqD-like protein
METKTNTNATSIQLYQGTQISFELGADVMVNLTDVAKAFPNKNLTQIINSQEIKDYCTALSKLQNYSFADLLLVRKGAPELGGGSWAHQKVALRVAQKLSPEFAVWVDTKLEELLSTGVATVNNDDEVIAQAMSVLQRRLEANQQRVQMLQGTVQLQQIEMENMAPKANYTDEVLQSTTTYTLTQIAHDLGMRSVFKFTEWASKNGWLYKQSRQWQPTAKVADKKYFATRTAKYVKDGEALSSLSTVVTERGRAWLHDMLKKKGGAND